MTESVPINRVRGTPTPEIAHYVGCGTPHPRRVLPGQGAPRPSGRVPRTKGPEPCPACERGFCCAGKFRPVAPSIRCPGWRIAGSFSRTIPISPGLRLDRRGVPADRTRPAGALKAGQGLALLPSIYARGGGRCRQAEVRLCCATWRIGTRQGRASVTDQSRPAGA